MPKFSVILPVRNGGEYLKLCVESVLKQTFQDFTLHVFDNCSTDGSLAWLHSLNDPRIIVYPSEISLSIEKNWGRIHKVPKNEFMTFLGHDDLLDAVFLERMNTFMEKHPGASFYQAHFRLIDEKGNTIRSCKPMDEIQTGPEFLAFFLSGMLELSIGQVVRSVDFDAVGGIPDYPNLLYADFELWMNLMQSGYKATLKDESCSYRIHSSSTTSSSSKLSYYYAFNRMFDFFIGLSKKGSEYRTVFERYGALFLMNNCQAVSHHLLQIPKKQRNGVSVHEFLKAFKERMDTLIPGNEYFPEKIKSIRIGKMIDDHLLLHQLFLMLKSVYPKPILK